eukprot:1081193-Pelagomonas_calceolata.AAC.1
MYFVVSKVGSSGIGPCLAAAKTGTSSKPNKDGSEEVAASGAVATLPSEVECDAACVWDSARLVCALTCDGTG